MRFYFYNTVWSRSVESLLRQIFRSTDLHIH